MWNYDFVFVYMYVYFITLYQIIIMEILAIRWNNHLPTWPVKTVRSANNVYYWWSHDCNGMIVLYVWYMIYTYWSFNTYILHQGHSCVRGVFIRITSNLSPILVTKKIHIFNSLHYCYMWSIKRDWSIVI